MPCTGRKPLSGVALALGIVGLLLLQAPKVAAQVGTPAETPEAPPPEVKLVGPSAQGPYLGMPAYFMRVDGLIRELEAAQSRGECERLGQLADDVRGNLEGFVSQHYLRQTEVEAQNPAVTAIQIAERRMSTEAAARKLAYLGEVLARPCPPAGARPQPPAGIVQNDDPLGTEWSESESGWSGRWVRRGRSNVFDATWTRDGYDAVRATLTIDITGDRVRVQRRGTSDGNDCEYQGTLTGNTASGTYGCGGGRWTATISGGPAPADAEWEDVDDLDLSQEPGLDLSGDRDTDQYDELFNLHLNLIAGTQGTPAFQLESARLAAQRCDRPGLDKAVAGLQDNADVLEDSGLFPGYSERLLTLARDDTQSALASARALEPENCVSTTPQRESPPRTSGSYAEFFEMLGRVVGTEGTPDDQLAAANDAAARCDRAGLARIVNEMVDALRSLDGVTDAEPGITRGYSAAIRTRAVNDLRATLQAAQALRVRNCTTESSIAGNGPLARSAIDLLTRIVAAAERCNEPRVLEHLETLTETLAEAQKRRDQAVRNSASNSARELAQEEVDGVAAVREMALRYELTNCPGGPADAAQTRRLEAIVAADALGWRTNRYLPGSMRDVRVIENTPAAGTFSVRGNYTYNETATGWVIAKFKGGRLDCLQYHDIGNTCRPPR